MEWKRTSENLEKIREAMNTSPVIQGKMDELARMAEEKGVSAEYWEEFKVRMMTTMFYKMAQMIPEVREDLANDIYDEFNK